jgi:uncharacterized protein DUF6843
VNLDTRLSPEKWVWILTGINVAIAVLLILSLRAVLLVLGAFAAYVSGWPIFVLLFVGASLSVIAILVGKQISYAPSRVMSFLINGGTLALHSVIILAILVIFVKVQHQRFIVPEGYQGDIYVIHSRPCGEPEKRIFWQVTYRVPPGGILETQAPVHRGLSTSAYYYEQQDGSLERIRGFWPTTVHRTPENLSDSKDFGVYFPRSGTASSSAGEVPVEFDEFYVGSKAYLLSGYKPSDLGAYLREHPQDCGQTAK